MKKFICIFFYSLLLFPFIKLEARVKFSYFSGFNYILNDPDKKVIDEDDLDEDDICRKDFVEAYIIEEPHEGYSLRFGFLTITKDILNEKPEKPKSALFRLEEIEPNRYAWLVLYQGEDKYLRVNNDKNAAFISNLVVGHTLVLSTLFNGPCNHRNIPFTKLELKRSYDHRWVPYPNMTISFFKRYNNGFEGNLRFNSYTGDLPFPEKKMNADFHLTRFKSFIQILRRMKSNLMTASAWSVEREFIGIGLTFIHGEDKYLMKEDYNLWMVDKYEFVVLRTKPGYEKCLYERTALYDVYYDRR